MSLCPVCLVDVNSHLKGEIVITRLDGSIVKFPEWLQLIKEEDNAKKLEKTAKRA